MNIYKVSCYSDCGSYFRQYLQSVTVTADTAEDALKTVKAWFKETGNKFIYPEERTVKVLGRETVKKWRTELLAENVQNNTIIDTFEDSDY